MSDEDDLAGGEGTGRRPAVAAATGAMLAAPLALGAGAIGGLLFGALAVWLLKPSATVEVPRDLTPEELAAACAADVEEDDELTTAQNRVAELERDVANRERRVRELEDQMASRNERGKEFVAELQRVKKELASAKEQLVAAEAEKKQLLDKLKQTEATLVVRTDERDRAREDALYNRWQDFLKNGKLEICDKGNRKKLGNCREVVNAALGTPERQAKFAHCIRSGQAAPILQERESKNSTLPSFSEWIGEDKKQTKGWMVIFCDPTLPERSDASLAESHLPK